MRLVLEASLSCYKSRENDANAGFDIERQHYGGHLPGRLDSRLSGQPQFGIRCVRSRAAGICPYRFSATSLGRAPGIRHVRPGSRGGADERVVRQQLNADGQRRTADCRVFGRHRFGIHAGRGTSMMALTLKKEQRLERVGLVDYFQDHRGAWTKAAQDAYGYIREGFAGQVVRLDDVVPPLKAVVEINQDLKAFLSHGKLTQLYWVTDFTELILDRVWDEIAEDR